MSVCSQGGRGYPKVPNPPPRQVPMGGLPPSQGTYPQPGSDGRRGYPKVPTPWPRYSPGQVLMGGGGVPKALTTPPPPPQIGQQMEYAAVGMPLAFTQEDFLVRIIFTQSCFCFLSYKITCFRVNHFWFFPLFCILHFDECTTVDIFTYMIANTCPDFVISSCQGKKKVANREFFTLSHPFSSPYFALTVNSHSLCENKTESMSMVCSRFKSQVGYCLFTPSNSERENFLWCLSLIRWIVFIVLWSFLLSLQFSLGVNRPFTQEHTAAFGGRHFVIFFTGPRRTWILALKILEEWKMIAHGLRFTKLLVTYGNLSYIILTILGAITDFM